MKSRPVTKARARCPYRTTLSLHHRSLRVTQFMMLAYFAVCFVLPHVLAERAPRHWCYCSSRESRQSLVTCRRDSTANPSLLRSPIHTTHAHKRFQYGRARNILRVLRLPLMNLAGSEGRRTTDTTPRRGRRAIKFRISSRRRSHWLSAPHRKVPWCNAQPVPVIGWCVHSFFACRVHASPLN